MTVAPKRRQTKLSFKLRQLIAKADPDNMRLRLYASAADALDQSAYCLGAKGERVRQLGAYATCLRYYEELTGERYSE